VAGSQEAIPPPVFDRLQYENTGEGGLEDLIMCRCQVDRRYTHWGQWSCNHSD